MTNVDANAERAISNMSFAEDCAVNHGINMRVFATVDKARAWLETEAGR